MFLLLGWRCILYPVPLPFVFTGEKHADCKTYTDPKTGTSYYFWYPGEWPLPIIVLWTMHIIYLYIGYLLVCDVDDETTQYLYESYPMVVSPLEGKTCILRL